MNLIHDTFLFRSFCLPIQVHANVAYNIVSGFFVSACRSGIKWYLRRSCRWFEGRIPISVRACSISVRSEETLVGWIWSLHPQSLSFLFLDICLNIHRMPIEWFVCT
eukprot:119348_1